MDHGEPIWFMEEKDFQRLNKVPKWACDERMEQSVPLKELWNYSDSSGQKKNNIFTGIFSKIISSGKCKENLFTFAIGQKRRTEKRIDGRDREPDVRSHERRIRVSEKP